MQRVLPRLVQLRTDPPLDNADDTFVKSVAVERQRRLLFYQAALNAGAGHEYLWARYMHAVLAADGRNPYYRWFGGHNQ